MPDYRPKAVMAHIMTVNKYNVSCLVGKGESANRLDFVSFNIFLFFFFRTALIESGDYVLHTAQKNSAIRKTKHFSCLP